MQHICPGSTFLKPAKLSDYSFVFDGKSTASIHTQKGAVANLIPNVGKHVWGALYNITPDDVAALDSLEDIPITYQKISNLSVQDSDGAMVDNVLTYLRPPQTTGRPTDEYKTTVLQGARDCDLPADYIAELEQL